MARHDLLDLELRTRRAQQAAQHRWAHQQQLELDVLLKFTEDEKEANEWVAAAAAKLSGCQPKRGTAAGPNSAASHWCPTRMFCTCCTDWVA